MLGHDRDATHDIGLLAVAVFLMGLASFSGCRSVDAEGFPCSTAKGCPSGFQCGTDELCHAPGHLPTADAACEGGDCSDTQPAVGGQGGIPGSGTGGTVAGGAGGHAIGSGGAGGSAIDGGTCVSGDLCSLSNAVCHVGRIACDTGAPMCHDTMSFQSDGSPCGSGMVCSNGVCSSCADGASCDRGQACKLGQTSCATGSPVCKEAGDADDGTPCGTGMVCAAGSCVACSQGATCVPTASPCHHGTLSCAGGTASCADALTPLDDGTTCGTSKVCSLGACVDCRAGAACDIPGLPCRVGQTSCNTGQATCIETGNATNGLACGSAMVCSSGECKACMTGASCVPTNACHAGALDCSAGTATCTDTTTALTDGASCGTNKVCSGGSCLACTEGLDCVPLGTTCKVGKTSCGSGMSACMQTGNSSDGSACGTNQVCGAGACVACASGSTCPPAAAPCHNGTLDCSGGTPVCKDQGTNLANGANCGTNLVCSGGSCKACKIGDVCTPNGNLCQTGATDCSTGTSVCMKTANVKDGSTCGASMVCSGGACTQCTENTACTPASAPCHTGKQSCATGSMMCVDTGTNAANGTSCGTNLACSAGACSCTQGTTCDVPSMPCKTGTTSCSTGTSVCGATGNKADSTPCAAGKTCSAGTCTTMTGCGTTPTLGCPCTSSGMLACNGARQKVQLVCAAPSSGLPGFAWQLNGTCASTENCDQTDGSCKTIIPQCVGKNPGDAFCDAQPGAPSPAPYLDVRKTCGADLVTTTSMTCSGVCDVVNGCQNPRCGDVKVETGEACDDGNTLPLDGCEPVSAGATNACQKSAITSVSAGYGHTCGLFKGGYVRCWGANDNNQLGLGHAQFMADHKPYELDVMDSSGGFTKPAGALDFGASVTATQVSAGLDFSCALLSDQTVHCWGVNASGQLGLGNTNPFLSGTPNTIGKVALGGNATAIAVAGSTACATLTDGTVRCWGSNAGAILGVGATVDLSTSTPVQTAAMYSGWVSLGATATAIDVGSSTACALLTGGSIRCWGSNGSGQLGTGMSTQFSRTMVPSAYSAVLLPSGKTATSISVGAGTVCTRLSDSTAQCWGDNSAGQIGNGTTASVGAFSSPATDGLVLTPAAGVVSITAGKGNSTCAFYSNGGGVHCWGDNSKGQLGYGDVTNRGNTQQTLPSSATACPPLSFGSGVTAATIAVGSGHMCAILSTGQLRCWGWNLYGQLGLGYTSPAPTDYVGGTASTTPSSSSTLVPLFPP